MFWSLLTAFIYVSQLSSNPRIISVPDVVIIPRQDVLYEKYKDLQVLTSTTKPLMTNQSEPLVLAKVSAVGLPIARTPLNMHAMGMAVLVMTVVAFLGLKLF